MMQNFFNLNRKPVLIQYNLIRYEGSTIEFHFI